MREMPFGDSLLAGFIVTMIGLFLILVVCHFFMTRDVPHPQLAAFAVGCMAAVVVVCGIGVYLLRDLH